MWTLALEPGPDLRSAPCTHPQQALNQFVTARIEQNVLYSSVLSCCPYQVLNLSENVLQLNSTLCGHKLSLVLQMMTSRLSYARLQSIRVRRWRYRLTCNDPLSIIITHMIVAREHTRRRHYTLPASHPGDFHRRWCSDPCWLLHTWNSQQRVPRSRLADPFLNHRSFAMCQFAFLEPEQDRYPPKQKPIYGGPRQLLRGDPTNLLELGSLIGTSDAEQRQSVTGYQRNCMLLESELTNLHCHDNGGDNGFFAIARS